jgi:PAS domain S-box-containing protein
LPRKQLDAIFILIIPNSMFSVLKRFGVLAGFSVLAGILVFNALMTKHQIDVQKGNEQAVTHTRQVLLAVEEAESTVKDAESGQRGYLLTGDSKYLTPYNRATEEIGLRFDNLAALTADDPIQQKNLSDLRGLTRDKLNEMAQTIALYRAGNAAQARAVVESDAGLLAMDKIRLVFARMRDQEINLENERSNLYRRSLHETAVGLWMATIGALMGLGALAWYVATERILREKHANQIREREEWLRTTLNSIADAVIATNEWGIVTFLNPLAEKLTGVERSKATGRLVRKVFPLVNEATGEPIIDPARQAIEQGAPVSLAGPVLLKNRGGELIPIETSAAPIRAEQGDLLGVVLVFRDISERLRAEETDRLLAAIVASSEDGILSKDLNGTITTWNSGAEKIFGYTADEIIGQSVSVLAPPERKNEMPEILERIRRGEHIAPFPSIRRTKDGKLIHVSVSVSPVRDANGTIVGASKIVRDITAQVEAQREIALQREWLQVTLQSIGDAVITTDTQGCVSYLNPVAEALSGWSSQDAAGRPLPEVMQIVNEITRQPAPNPVTRVLREGVTVGLANHTVLISRDGTERAIDDSAAPIRDNRGQLIGVVLVFRDVTAERRSQQVLQQTEKLAAAARLSATVAHEMNNPLAAVVNLIYIARNTPGAPPGQVKYLDQAEQELERVAHIARQTLGFYRRSSPQGQVEIAPLIDSVLKLYSNKLAAKNITVRRAFDDCGCVFGVAGELRQAISNLIANAIDAVAVDGTILVSAQANQNNGHRMVEMMVADDGPGIAKENIDRLFEPFFTTKKDVGTGLGLWATKNIVERHGGNIAVRGNGGRGAAFTIQLPCEPEPEGSSQSN